MAPGFTPPVRRSCALSHAGRKSCSEVPAGECDGTPSRSGSCFRVDQGLHPFIQRTPRNIESRHSLGAFPRGRGLCVCALARLSRSRRRAGAHARSRHRRASRPGAPAAPGSRILALDRHHKWKRAYFEQGGVHHPTDYVLFPDDDGSRRLLAIPAENGSSCLKRALPAEWAGLVEDVLSRAVGVPGAAFCHKNRHVAVFASEAAARAASARWRLDQLPA